VPAKRKLSKSQVPEKVRLEKNQKARARHWQKTGVSDKTIAWMRTNGML